jgi:ABC-type Fe3+-hydroxamate transport system substrate-binding protein
VTPGFALRIVSLVPSLTESLWDLGVGRRIVGVTKFCVRPEEARTRAGVVGGTKDPDVDAILALRPDLVVADEDENKPEHLRAFVEAGVRVHTTRVRTVRDAGRALVALGGLVGRGIEAEGWRQRIQEKEAALRQANRLVGRLRVFVPVWRRPSMTMSKDTYISDLVSVTGLDNVSAEPSEARYFEVDLADVKARRPDVVLLPTEPYRFKEDHRQEFADALGVPVAAVEVVDGQALTWFGTRTLEGLDVVAGSVARVRGRLQNA